MQFNVSSNDLLQKLVTMGKVIDDKSPLPILSNYLFELRGGQLILTAANNEMRMTSALEVNNTGGQDGSACVSGVKLTEYIKLLPEQAITFNINDECTKLEIVSQSGKSEQQCTPATDFPQEQPLDEELHQLTISESCLLSGISATLFAVANDDLRPIMNGIYFDIEPGRLSFVSTDTHKLVRYMRTDVNTGDMTNSFTLNKKPAAVLRGILDKTEDPVGISFGQRNVCFETTAYKYTCRLTEGQFPAYKSVIPTDNECRVNINRGDFQRAISRASVFMDTSHLVKCELFSNSMVISTQDLDFSCSAKETIPCQYEGNEMSIGFNGKFLGECLSNIDCDDVLFELSDPSKPGLISPAAKTSDNEDVLVVMMPMRV